MPLSEKQGRTRNMSNSPPTSLPFVATFDAAGSDLPGAGLKWLENLRQSGIEHFNAHGLPSPKSESWKYTRLSSLEDTEFRPVNDEDRMAALDTVPSLLPDPGGHPRLVFVNGHIRPNFWIKGDLPDGVHLECFRDVPETRPDWFRERLGALAGSDESSLVQLNMAMMDTGFVLRVEKGVRVSTPIEVVFVGGLTDLPVAYSPRNLIVLEKGAEKPDDQQHVGIAY